jgi:KaiC/GvpD/RAD55 family RecA-like ATPase
MRHNNHFYLIDRFTQTTKVDFLFEGLIPRRGVGVLWGKTGAGKSLFCHLMISALATGAPLVINPDDTLEGCPKYRGATLYFCGEGEDGLAGRLQAAEEALGDYKALLSTSHLPVIPIGIGYRRLQGVDQIPAILEMVAQKVEEYRALGYDVRLIVFDTLISCFSIQDDNNNAEMDRVVSALKEFGHAFDCFVLSVAHPSKSRDGREIGVRGASAYVNAVDISLNLKAVNGSVLRTLVVKKIRDGGTSERSFSLRLETFSDLPAIVPDTQHTKKEKATKDPKQPTFTATQELIIAALKSSETGLLHKSRIQNFVMPIIEKNYTDVGKKPALKPSIKKDVIRNLEKLAEHGVIVCDASGNYRLADTANPTTIATAVGTEQPSNDQATTATNDAPALDLNTAASADATQNAQPEPAIAISGAALARAREQETIRAAFRALPPIPPPPCART